jgi:hypothetical protein
MDPWPAAAQRPYAATHSCNRSLPEHLVVQAAPEHATSTLVSLHLACTLSAAAAAPLTWQVFITYLTAPLAARMHATEGGYDLLSMSGIRLHVGCSLMQLQR